MDKTWEFEDRVPFSIARWVHAMNLAKYTDHLSVHRDDGQIVIRSKYATTVALAKAFISKDA